MNQQCDCLDYPVSWTYYRSHCKEQHGFDPGGNEFPEEVQPERIQEPKWTARQWDKVELLESEVVGWRQKHAEALKEIEKLQRIVDDKRHKKYKFTS